MPIDFVSRFVPRTPPRPTVMRIPHIIRIGVPIALALLLLYLAFRAVDVGQLVSNMAGAKLWAILLSSAIGLSAFVVRAHRWALLMEPLGGRPGLWHTTAALMAGYLANLALPRLGELTRCAAMAKGITVPFNRILGTVLMERVIDVFSLLTCILLSLAVEQQRISGFFRNQVFEPLQMRFTGVPFLAWAVVALVIILVGLGWMRYRRPENSLLRRIQMFLQGIIAGVSTIRHVRNPGWFLLDSVLIWFLYFLGVYLCFFALPQTQLLDWTAGLVVLVIGGLGMAAPVQGGFGAYHLLVSGGLMLYGMDYEDGLAFATLVHSLGLIQILLLGIPAMYILGRMKQPDAGKIDT